MDIKVKEAFTQAVKHYIDIGFVFNVETMGGLQDEIARVDLVKGTVFIRIAVYRVTRWDKNKYQLFVGTMDRHGGDYVGTIWTDDLQTVRAEII